MTPHTDFKTAAGKFEQRNRENNARRIRSIDDGTPVGRYDPTKPPRYWCDDAGRVVKQPDVPNPRPINSPEYRENFSKIDWSK